MDAATTQASVIAGREFGFEGRHQEKIDGRRLRSRGTNTQLNLKVTEDEKSQILRDASRLIQDPNSPIKNIGEFVVLAVAYFVRITLNRGRGNQLLPADCGRRRKVQVRSRLETLTFA